MAGCLSVLPGLLLSSITETRYCMVWIISSGSGHPFMGSLSSVRRTARPRSDTASRTPFETDQRRADRPVGHRFSADHRERTRTCAERLRSWSGTEMLSAHLAPSQTDDSMKSLVDEVLHVSG